MAVTWKTDGGAIRIPDACACCSGPVEDVFTVQVRRTKANAGTLPLLAVGVVSTTTQTTTWQFPACKACRKHARWNSAAWVLATLLGGLAWIGGMMWIANSYGPKGGAFAVAFFLVPTVALVASRLLLKRLMVATTSACVGCSSPVSAAPTFFGGGTKFKFRNDDWGRRFLEMNAPG